MTLTVLVCLFFTISVSALPPKHVSVSQAMSWIHAQMNCREQYTDLSPILNAEEDEIFKQSHVRNIGVWIGLYRDHSTGPWMWSGAGLANDTNFIHQKNIYLHIHYIYGLWTKQGWSVATENHRYVSFCLNLIAIDQRMLWEDALMYCRGQHTDLSSLLSDTETQLALSEIRSDHVTEKVWIGLRFLEDQWMWVNGEPLSYTAWAHGGDFIDWHCPPKGRCGVLDKTGVWEDWDCNDKLNFICY